MSTPGKSKWSAQVSEHSHTLDLSHGIFKGSPAEIARSLKQSAEASDRRKSNPYRSAMSMLTLYINRAGRNLDTDDRARLEQAKPELRHLYGRDK